MFAEILLKFFIKGADSLVCCEKPMELQKEKLKDPEIGEKHVPIIEGNLVKIGGLSIQ